MDPRAGLVMTEKEKVEKKAAQMQQKVGRRRVR
jgi:hypothetical protein